MKKIILILLSGLFLYSCQVLSTRYRVENSEGMTTDVYGYEFGSGRFSSSFGVYEPSQTMFVYQFYIDDTVLPDVTLHSFLLTNKKGDAIPYVICMKYSVNLVKDRYMVKTSDIITNRIDDLKLPLAVSLEKDSIFIQNRGNPRKLEILVKIPDEFKKMRKIYVSYDIEVGNKRFIKNKILYKRKLVIDFNPV